MNDMISRSAMLEEVIRTFNEYAKGAHFRAACDALRAKVAIIRMLNEAPAVDAEPVRNARWNLNMHYGDYECSECGAGDFTALVFKQHKMHYCPNCGAKMDAEVES